MAGPARLRAILPKQEIISAKFPPPRIQKWLKKVGEDFRKEMKIYPPPVPSSRYRRTGFLRTGWDSPLILTPFSVTIINPVEYSRYVQGPVRSRSLSEEGELEPRQRPFFRGRGWQSTTVVSRKVFQKHIGELRLSILPVRFPGVGTGRPR